MSDNTAKLALITGGMGGLGEALCRKLAQSGFRVVTTFSSRNTQAQDWLARQKADGFDFHAYPMDVTQFESCKVSVANIMAEHGTIEVLVNNAGITRDATLKKMQLEDWRAVLSTNLDSVFHLSKLVIDGMLEKQWGRIINISSVNGQRGAFGQVNYAAAKAGMHGFTKALALEVAKKHITVNTVSPGYLNTKMVAAIPAEILQSKILPEIPVGRLGEPAEVADLVSWLCSDSAAFVTGANFAINGGQHMY
ncbi:acetoacetyl-CoA reductase [Ampullimonas aquatilis]|uniref:acetoacetyl-CoA reductase n=1 Tax=Ampullimonas aquatilis TaxID=1341549 RepID=UPI003C76D119